MENLASNSFLFNVVFRHYILAKKSSLVSGNRPGENPLITHPPAQSNAYQNIFKIFRIFNFKKQTNKQKNTKNTKKQKKLKKKNYEVAIHEKKHS